MKLALQAKARAGRAWPLGSGTIALVSLQYGKLAELPPSLGDELDDVDHGYVQT